MSSPVHQQRNASRADTSSTDRVAAIARWLRTLTATRYEPRRVARVHALHSVATLAYRHPSHDSWLVEVSNGYVRDGSGVADGTARAARRAIVQACGGRVTTVEDAREQGYPIRELRPGHLRGALAIVQGRAIVAAREVAAAVPLPERCRIPVLPGSGVRTATSAGDLERAGYTVIDAEAPRGNAVSARCPWHDDRSPSLSLLRGTTPGGGPCRCHAAGCGRVGSWQQDRHGRIWVRPVRDTDAGVSDEPGEVRSYRQGSGPRGASGWSVVPGRYGTDPVSPRLALSRAPTAAAWRGFAVAGPWRARILTVRRGADAGLGVRGCRHRASSSRDVVAAMVAAQRACGPGARETAASAHRAVELLGTDDPRAVLPALYLGVDRCAPSAWLEVRLGVWVPSRWRAVASEWVVTDIDGVVSSPADWRRALDGVGRTCAGVARRHPGLSGRVCVTRTSAGGVQVLWELALPCWDPGRFHEIPAVAAMERDLDGVALWALRRVGYRGGAADRSVHRPLSLVRRPGPRVDRDGVGCCAELAYAAGHDILGWSRRRWLRDAAESRRRSRRVAGRVRPRRGSP